MGLIEIYKVQVRYDGLRALKGVSVRVKTDEIVSVIGANGSGKSTLLGCIAGLIRICNGRISFRSERIDNLKAQTVVKKGISLVPEGRQIFGGLKVSDNLILGAYSIPRKKRKDILYRQLDFVYGLFPALKGRGSRLACTLSGGEQQMLAIARALMAKPVLLMLDEPSMGLAPLVVRDIFRTLRDLSQKGTCVLLVEQNARQALGISDYSYVLELGKIAREGSGRELLRDEGIARDYLGG